MMARTMDGAMDRRGWQRMAAVGSFCWATKMEAIWLNSQGCLTGRCGHRLLFANGSFAESEDMRNSRAIIIQ